MKLVRISVQDFAHPSPRTGSIEPSSSFASAEEGIHLHQKIQALRKEEESEYEAEVPITWSFERSGYRFEIHGRMDGLIQYETPVIEEIKSSFNIFDLGKKIKERRFDHPYFIQLVTYGYFYWLHYGVKPELTFYLISSRNEESFDFNLFWELKEYEKWLDKRLEELVNEAKLAEKRFLRRKKISENVLFPFEKPRSGQKELIQFIEDGFLDKKKMLLQAPTGLGKTMGVLYPSVKDSLSRGQRVVYLTPKNSQQSVALEAVELFQEKGSQIKSLTITAKNKICMKAEPLCNPDYCEFARDYYDKIHIHDLKNELSKKRKLTSKVMKNFAQKYEVCPFELQLEAVIEADVVICDYNYVFGHQSALGKISQSGFSVQGKPNLVIDEAHNLPTRAMANFSPELSGYFLETLRTELEKIPKKFKKQAITLLNSCYELIKSSSPEEKETRECHPNLEEFQSLEEELKLYLSDYLNSDVEIKSRDPVLRLVFYWSDFVQVLLSIQDENSEFFITSSFNGRFPSIKITCCDASALIKERYNLFEQVVAFSATLKPFDYFAQLSGLQGQEILKKEFLSPFKKEHRKVLIIPQISTKYSEREKNYPKIAQTIERITSLRPGNYLVFLPSFDFLEKVLSVFIPPEGFRVLKQNRFIKNEEVEHNLEVLRSLITPVILFAVQGGVFSEGVDYAGDMTIGVFVVGPPLPNFDFEREKMKKYYQSKYQAGTDYAYTYPAMAKAVQAAGRVIRSETDKGIIILMDNRFLEGNYSKTLPQDWFDKSPEELVSHKILKDLSDFWGLTRSSQT